MGITDVIAELYRRGIDCGIESFRGTGLLAWVVDERNRRVERHFDIDQLQSVDEWLMSEAARQYESQNELQRDTTTRSVLEELAGSERKDPKRITSRERYGRDAPGVQERGAHS